jgi:hypothetical protein
MKSVQKVAFEEPARYCIMIIGSLDKTWFKDIYDLEISVNKNAGGVRKTILKGEMKDQATLIGVLNTLYNMGYTLLSVERIIET